MSRKYAVLFAVLSLLGISCFIWWLLYTPETPINGKFTETQTVLGDSKEDRPLPIDTTVPEKERLPAGGAPEPEEPVEEKRFESSERKLLQGTITVTDEFEVSHTAESGSFSLVGYQKTDVTPNIRCYTTSWNIKVNVVEGCWSVELPVDMHLIQIARIRLDDRFAFLDEPGDEDEMILVPANCFLALHALWEWERDLPPSILRVLAEDTGLDLDEIELVTGDYGEEHPGFYKKKNVVCTSARSPIDLTEFIELGDSVTYCARSPGYAWGSIWIDDELGGECLLLLKRGGCVEVTLKGYDPKSQASLRFRRFDMDPIYTVFDQKLGEKHRLDIDSLAVGRYRVSVEIGDPWEDFIVLGTSEVEIIAGRRSRLTLWLEPAPRVETAPLKGILIVPQECTPEIYGSFFSLTIRLEDTPLEGNPDWITIRQKDFKPLMGRKDAFSWDAGMVQTGRYELDFGPFDYSISLTVPPEGLTDVLIEIPPFQKVSLRVIDASTGTDAEIRTIGWRPKTSPLDDGGSISRVEKNYENRLFEFMAPLGEITVSISPDDYQDFEKILNIQTGMNTFTLELERACGFHVFLKDGDTIVPCDFIELWLSFLKTVREVKGEGSSTSCGYRSGGLIVKVSEPGRYLFKMPDIDGYLPIPEQVVIVEPGKMVKHIVNLQRKP